MLKDIYKDIRDMKPMTFTVDVEVPLEDEGIGRGSQAINDKPFVITRITHQIIRPLDLANERYENEQNGLYRIDWSLYQQHRFWQGTVPMADAQFGSVRTGIFYDLEAPVALEGNKTLYVEVMNARLKANNFTVQVLFHGLEDWRDPEIIAQELKELEASYRRNQPRV